MANEYLVNSEDMTAVADAIRNKGGTTEALSFPDGFVQAVGAIEAGSGKPWYEDNSGKVVLQTYDIVSDTAKSIELSRNDTVRRIAISSITDGGKVSLNYCKVLESVSFPSLTNGNNQWSIQDMPVLKEINLPVMTSFGYRLFYKLVAVERLELPAVTYCSWMCSTDMTSLKELILPVCKGFGDQAFGNAQKLEAVVLRRSDAVASLDNVSAFKNSPLTGYGGTYSGHVYVPSALIESYQTATNWSTYYANYPEIFQPIEGSKYE